MDADQHWERISGRTKRCHSGLLGANRLCDTRIFDFVGLDLCKKFGYAPSIDVSENIVAALDAPRGRGWRWRSIRPAGTFPREVYPSPMILRVLQASIPALVTADAHDIAFHARLERGNLFGRIYRDRVPGD